MSLYVGTLGVQLNHEKIITDLSSKTTPDIFELFHILHNLGLDDALNICIELSSHALDQGRLNNIDWLNSASILNIANDHMDYHKNIETYRDAKFEIFLDLNLVFDLLMKNHINLLKNTILFKIIINYQ